MIYTAIPFGYAFISLALLALFVTGIFLLATKGKRNNLLRKLLGLALLIGAPAIVIIDTIQHEAMDWNPKVDAHAVAGTYADKHHTLSLQQDATYSLRSDETYTSGTWSIYDWNLDLSDSSNGATLNARIITYSGHPYVMLKQPEDPDEWDGNLGLKRTDNISVSPLPTPSKYSPPVRPYSDSLGNSRFDPVKNVLQLLPDPPPVTKP